MNNKQISDITNKAIDKFITEYSIQCDSNKLAIDTAIARILSSSKRRSEFEALVVRKNSDIKDILTEMSEGKVFDVCGAGDTFLAALVYEFLKTKNMQTDIEFANKAAAIAVTHPGAYHLTKKDIESLYEKV